MFVADVTDKEELEFLLDEISNRDVTT